MNAEAYSVGYAILKSDEFYFAVTTFPVWEEGQNQAKCRCVRVCTVVGQRYVWDVVEDVIIYAVETHCLRRSWRDEMGSRLHNPIGFWA